MHLLGPVTDWNHYFILALRQADGWNVAVSTKMLVTSARIKQVELFALFTW